SEPVSRTILQDHPILKSLSILTIPRGTNFSITDEQLWSLEALVAERGGRRIVKIAPGEGARFWEDCLRDGTIYVGWDEVGDLVQYPDKERFRDAFANAYRERYKNNEAQVSRKANEVWTLRELRPGDLIIANRGTSEVLAVGRVRSS